MGKSRWQYHDFAAAGSGCHRCAVARLIIVFEEFDLAVVVGRLPVHDTWRGD